MRPLECFECGSLFIPRIEGTTITLNSSTVGGHEVFFCEDCVTTPEFQARYRRGVAPEAEPPTQAQPQEPQK